MDGYQIWVQDTMEAGACPWRVGLAKTGALIAEGIAPTREDARAEAEWAIMQRMLRAQPRPTTIDLFGGAE
jgi:hypothetical protein